MTNQTQRRSSNTRELIVETTQKKKRKKHLEINIVKGNEKKNAPLTVANMISLACDKRSHLKAADLELMEVVVKV